MYNYYEYKTQCEFSAGLFQLSCKLGYDSKEFIKLIALTELGEYYYGKDCFDAWLSAAYVMEDFQNSYEIKKGKVLPTYFMHWLGYLYRFWTYNYDKTVEQVYTTISIDDLLYSYEGLHVMDWAEIVETIEQMQQE